jgi:hypothetical protein
MEKTLFRNLTPQQIEKAKEIYRDKTIKWDIRMAKLTKLFGGISERAARRWCISLGLKERTDIEIKDIKKAKTKKHDKGKKRFLITSAQAATPVHDNFIDGMEALAKYYDAEILVIPFRYHNPTSIFTEASEENEWWDKRILKYLTLNRHDLNKRISILSDVKIQPTNANPLQGLEGMTGEHSSIIGHPRMELRSIPVMEGSSPKILFTTGACTKENYTDTKLGKKGEFHHSLGFAVVEIKDSETFFFRQVSANSKGEFIDLNNHVDNGKVTKEKEVEAIILGDVHVADCDPMVTDVTFNDLFKRIKPKKVFLHDIISSNSISHHNLNNPFILHQQEKNGTNSLADEINQMIEWLKKVESYDVYIVKSNHDEHIDKFLQTTDWRKMASFKNALPYMEYSTAILRGDAPNGIVPYVINKYYPKFKCLGHNDNVIVKGWLLSVHGHIGASGSRGSLQQYSKLATKTVTGHSHSIGRIGGAVAVGTSTHLRLAYNKGASSWVNAHGIINRLGKFQHIVFFKTKNGMEYTTLK